MITEEDTELEEEELETEKEKQNSLAIPGTRSKVARFHEGRQEMISPTEIGLREWEIVKDFDLEADQLSALGYLSAGVIPVRVEQLTGISAHKIRVWLEEDPIFVMALQKIRERRESFIQADARGLTITAFEQLAWFLRIDPEESVEEDGRRSFRFSEIVKKTLFQEKRRVAEMLAQTVIAKDMVTKVQVEHKMAKNVDDDTIRNIAIILTNPDSANNGNRTPHIAELTSGSIDGEYALMDDEDDEESV